LGYEFGKEELVRLWIAEGFIWVRQLERMEDTGSVYFDYLVSMEFIEPSTYDCTVNFDSYMSDEKFLVPPVFDSNGGTGKLLYKVNEAKASYLEVASSAGGYLSVLDGKLDDASELTLHLSLPCESIDDQISLETLKKCKYLRTLHLFSGCGYSVKQVPRDLFLSLKLLRTLNLSRTLISELPSSIGNVNSLRYLDVSHTRIRHLPESIDCLSNLQTLKLRGCLEFVALPKNMKKLTNLRHLELDIIRQLISMPKRIGNLTNLQTLSAFLVGRDDECGIEELMNMIDLSGTFCISRLERVSSLDKAKEAALIDKKYLSKLDLRWSDIRVAKPEEEEEILECLRPHSGLREIQILFYGGSKLPSWISDPSFADLVAITLYKCRNCNLLPSLGELPSLEFLCIKEMNEVKEIDHQFCRNGKDKRNQGFAKLKNLTIDVMLNLEEWMGVENGDLPALHKLTLECCPKLIALPSLWCLNSLEHLEIKHCPKLLCLPNEGLPTSLEFLLIKDCPELKERCCKGEGQEGQDWGKIKHVRNIWIDHQEVSSS
jgi:leucine-rich repeat protein SHOC2